MHSIVLGYNCLHSVGQLASAMVGIDRIQVSRGVGLGLNTSLEIKKSEIKRKECEKMKRIDEKVAKVN